MAFPRVLIGAALLIALAVFVMTGTAAVKIVFVMGAVFGVLLITDRLWGEAS
ncbi:MAG: hypothetical protein JWN52_3624 [Actinomycetia bacterium]|nr:hypothetical protein [Actinomycetes bacterium]